MFGIMYRPQFDTPPAPGQDFTCQDFHCPQRWSCKHRWMRRFEYWAMICWTEGKRKYKAPPIWTPYRAAFQHQCDRYELDKPREWLRGVCDAPGRPCEGCEDYAAYRERAARHMKPSDPPTDCAWYRFDARPEREKAPTRFHFRAEAPKDERQGVLI